MSRMFDRLAKGETAVGGPMVEHGTEFVELLGYVGLDFVCIDLMVSSFDWSEAADMVRACNRYNVTPWIRLQAYPWSGHGSDPRLPADVMRAIAIGAEGVTASVNTAEAAASMLEAATDLHPRPYIKRGGVYPSRAGIQREDSKHKPYVFPSIESLEGVNNLDEIMKVEGLRAIFLAMGDLSRELGHPGEDRHPEIRSLIKDVVRRASERDIAIFANVLAFRVPGTDTPEYAAEGVMWLRDNGVKAVWLPRVSVVVQAYFERVLNALAP